MIAWFGTLQFIQSEWLRLAVALPGGLLVGRALRKWFANKRLLFVREQYKWLLEHLLSRLSAGATLEHAFMDAPSQMSLLLGSKSELLVCLNRIKSQLVSRRSLEFLMPDLVRSLPCPEARSCLLILPGLRQAGGNIVQFIRQHLRMVSEQLSLLQSLKADTLQRQTEAMILAGMPFAMAALLQQTTDLYGSQASSLLLESGMLLSYVLALAAVVLTLSSISFGQINRSRRKYQKPRLRLLDTQMLHRCGRILNSLYKNRLPQVYGTRLLQLIKAQSRYTDHSNEQHLDVYFKSKVLYFLAGLLPGCILLVADPFQFFWVLLLPIGLCLLQDQQIFAMAGKQQMDNKLDYPTFLNLTSTLLQAGVSLHISLEIGMKSLNQQANLELQHDLAETNKKLLLGMTASRVLEELAISCTIPDVQSALLLMVRYDREGRSENLQLLEMQTAACWSLHRVAMQKHLELQSLRLLLPMAMDLIAIMLIAILPAVQSLQSI